MEGYIGTILMWGADFAPVDWELCRGQLLAVQNYAALFSLIGNRFGGDGRVNFALPNLSGYIPMGAVSTSEIGQKVGSNTLALDGSHYLQGLAQVALTANNMPSHTHNASFAGSTTPQTASVAIPAVGTTTNVTEVPSPSVRLCKGEVGGEATHIYSTSAETTTLKPFNINLPTPAGTITVAATGGGQTLQAPVTVTAATSNVSIVQPSLRLNFIICVNGLYPSRP